jgi:hypothetical protein
VVGYRWGCLWGGGVVDESHIEKPSHWWEGVSMGGVGCWLVGWLSLMGMVVFIVHFRYEFVRQFDQDRIRFTK